MTDPDTLPPNAVPPDGAPQYEPLRPEQEVVRGWINQLREAPLQPPTAAERFAPWCGIILQARLGPVNPIWAVRAFLAAMQRSYLEDSGRTAVQDQPNWARSPWTLGNQEDFLGKCFMCGEFLLTSGASASWAFPTGHEEVSKATDLNPQRWTPRFTQVHNPRALEIPTSRYGLALHQKSLVSARGCGMENGHTGNLAIEVHGPCTAGTQSWQRSGICTRRSRT